MRSRCSRRIRSRTTSGSTSGAASHRDAGGIGWVRNTTPDGHCSDKDMDRLQSKLPPHHRYSLHVNFVSLGREFCTALRPKCVDCPINQHCKKVGTNNR